MKLPGYSRTDSIPAWLSPGERVINSLSTKLMDTFMPGFMDSINKIRHAQEIPDVFSKQFDFKKLPSRAVPSGNGREETVVWRWQLQGKDVPLKIKGPANETRKLLKLLEADLKRFGLSHA